MVAPLLPARLTQMAKRSRLNGGTIAPALAAGVVASFAATLLMLALRQSAGIITLPELLAERILPTLDTSTFVSLLVQFGKIKPLAAELIGQIVIGALLALVYPGLLDAQPTARGWLPRRREWLVAGGIAIALWLIALIVFWPVLAENLMGYPVGQARAITIIGLAAIFALYGAALAFTYRALLVNAGPALSRLARRGGQTAVADDSTPANPTRRALLLRSAAVGGGGLVVGATGTGVLVRSLLARSTLHYDGMATGPLSGGTVAPITPTSEFYLVTKNVIDPNIALADWALDVGGLVQTPARFDLARLQALPQVTRAITLECISNPVGGYLISNAMWRGVTIEALLHDRGGALPAGKEVVFTSADGFVSGQALDELIANGAMLAWEINGESLPSRHGYPVRVLIPNYYGEHSSKWLTSIEVVEHHVKGFYQQQGWYWGPLHTFSRIDFPRRGAHIATGQAVRVAGIAFAGSRGIQRVELSADGGSSWQPATLQPALSQDSWVLWEWDWTPAAPGKYKLMVRATDGTGAVQTPQQQCTVPAGATGYHSVPVQVG
ncbi:MAG: molybdopterin-dependent oxidoreductase [Ktedonobacterales bacterium]